MTIEKLPSGNFRIRQYYKGKRYSITLNHKPSKQEAIQALASIMEDVPEKGSFMEYAQNYIKARKNVISPATVRGYNSILRSISDDFKELQLSRITQKDIQLQINKYAIKHAPKTTDNFHGFIRSVISFYRPSFNIQTTLPQKEKTMTYLPTTEEVKAILKEAKGTEYEVAIWLATFGLRRSEIGALTIDDLSDDNVLTINKAMVKAENGGWVIKSPKTKESNRQIILTNYVADLIRNKGYVYKGDLGNILEALHRYQDKLGIHRFRLHALRHYFASTLSKTESEADILALGGWSTPHVMKTVYRHSMATNESKKNAIDKLSKGLI